LLQPTFPFRGAADIDACIDKFEQTQADCVVTVHRVPHQFNPHWVYFESADGTLHLSTGETAPIPRRQELPPAFHRSGSIYVTRTKLVMEQSLLYGERLVGLETPTDEACNIDSLDDWERAEALLASKS
jgi:CMP-N-acetylneuraminic acid synthetase